MAKNTVSQVNAFLGLNEAADSFRELALGEASKAENWQITDGSNITLRPGIRNALAKSGEAAGLWTGYIRDRYFMIAAVQYPEESHTDLIISAWKSGKFETVTETPLYHDYGKTVVKIFPLFDKVFVSVGANIWSVDFTWSGEVFLRPEEPYVPIVVTGAPPTGGGDLLENLNILTARARAEFSADGEATEYHLPTLCRSVTSVIVDNVVLENAGRYDRENNTYIFDEAPVEGINNVSITFEIADSEIMTARNKFAAMPYWEAYNGQTDSRLFFYGDGSHITYYTGVEASGRGSALYIPAGNEIAVDMSDSPITGATRHHSKLMFFKPDCTASVTYEPLTLADGRTIAGFTMRTIHKEAGNVPYGQVEIVNNNPRSISGGNLYEWVLPNIYSTDERNAKVISDKVCRTLAAADLTKIVTLDDSTDTTYYMFLNDSEGTVLVNRYNLGTWVIYKSKKFCNVRYARMYGAWVVFLTQDGGTAKLSYLDSSWRYDEKDPIHAKWETGYMDFKADYLRKFSSQIWLSVKPEMASKFTVTASTDRREEYAVKEISESLFNYGAVHYGYWTYKVNHAPVIKKIKLKVKKFAYYMMKFEINTPGATATILGYDQKIRYGSEVK